MKKRNMRKMRIKTAVICLSCLVLMINLVACGASEVVEETDSAREKGTKEQTVGLEAETAVKEKNGGDETVSEQKDYTFQTDIRTIRITDGATGEECIFTLEENPEDFVEIIEKFEKVDALDGEMPENQTAIVGYQYWLRLEDETGEELHSVVPGGQEIQIDGVNYADYSKGTAMELFLAVDAACAKRFAEGTAGASGGESQSATSNGVSGQQAGIQQAPSKLQEPDTLDGISMEVTYATSRGANLVFYNDTDLEIEYGEDYSLQAYRDGLWYDVEYIIDNAAFNAIAYNVPQGGSGSWGVRWTFFHGELPQGTYRIVKGVMDFRGTGDYTTYQLAAEFTVK